MKIFAVYFKITITKKPEWFDDFCKSYMGTSIFHITLVQPRYIDKGKISNIKSKIVEVLKNFNFTDKDKRVIFDTLIKDKEDEKYIFMLNARQNDTLNNFQKLLTDALKDYEDYCDPKNKEYEINFRPHLTIGVNIDSGLKQEVDECFLSDYVCEGKITKLVLPVVKDRSVEEADNPKNLILFNIK